MPLAAEVQRELTDAELLQRVAAKDHEAFRVVIKRHNQRLFRVARAILKDDAEAEDAVQESYVLAYCAIANFRGDAKLSTWLVRIVANEAIGRLRKRSRSAEVIRLDGELPEDIPEDAMEETQSERAAVRAETRKLLETKIDELPGTFRAVFVLRAIEELSVEETAAALKIPEATVRTRFFRARSQLREALSKEIDLAYGDVFAFAGKRCDRITERVLARLNDVRVQGA
jgi:RNA polymerase sigma-70 factor (ECF subfamily)